MSLDAINVSKYRYVDISVFIRKIDYYATTLGVHKSIQDIRILYYMNHNKRLMIPFNLLQIRNNAIGKDVYCH